MYDHISVQVAHLYCSYIIVLLRAGVSLATHERRRPLFIFFQPLHSFPVRFLFILRQVNTYTVLFLTCAVSLAMRGCCKQISEGLFFFFIISFCLVQRQEGQYRIETCAVFFQAYQSITHFYYSLAVYERRWVLDYLKAFCLPLFRILVTLAVLKTLLTCDISREPCRNLLGVCIFRCFFPLHYKLPDLCIYTGW